MYIYQDHIKIEKKLKDFNYDWKGKTVLDLGCNIGLLGKYVNSRGAVGYLGVDTKEDMIEIGKDRYGLELIAGDVGLVLDRSQDFDITIAMALFHHFPDKKFKEVLKKIKSKVLIFEVPVGDNPEWDRYYLRTQMWYSNMVRKLYGNRMEVYQSGATNDPWNKRVIFKCQKNEERG